MAHKPMNRCWASAVTKEMCPHNVLSLNPKRMGKIKTTTKAKWLERQGVNGTPTYGTQERTVPTTALATGRGHLPKLGPVCKPQASAFPPPAAHLTAACTQRALRELRENAPRSTVQRSPKRKVTRMSTGIRTDA